MKKILYLHIGAELYGSDIVLLELLKNIDKTKYEPYVILPCEGPLVQKMKENKIKVEVIQYPILRRKYFNIKGICQYCLDYIKYSKKLYNIVAQEKIDILHTNTSAVLEGVYIKKRAKIKHIWHIHEIIMKPKFLYQFLCKLIAKYADEVVTVSEAVKKHLMDSNYFKKEQVKVIYNGVDRNKFHPNNDTKALKEEFNIKEDNIIVGMIGRVNAWKGQQDFLKAISPLLKKYDNLTVAFVGGVFAGEEWRMEELKKLIEQEEKQDRIILSDFRQDTPNVHNLFDIFVLPSTNPDPLPTVVLEAMATGKPVVGYRHGGICEMVEENTNGLFANVKDTEDLSQKIEELIQNEEKRKRFGQASLQRQERLFSVESYVANFEAMYDKL